MRMQSMPKKATNLSLDQMLLAEAKELGVNLSRAAEQGLRRAVISAKSERWKLENAEALASSNDWIDAHGLPLEQYRQF